MKRNKFFKLNPGILDSLNIYFYLEKDTKKAEKFLEKKFNDNDIQLSDKPSGKPYRGFTVSYLPHERKVFIWMPTFSGKIRDYSTLTHEILHLVHTILNYVDIKLNDETEEIYAYYEGHFMEEILTKIKKG